MLYTLYYQTQYRDPITVVTSKPILRLLKIEKMTFHHAEGISFIVDANSRYPFSLGDGCLSDNEHADFMRFNDAVNGGKYFKSYDYTQRVRDRGIWSL